MLPHGDDGLVLGVGAQEWERGMGFLQIAPNRNHFADAAPVFEHEIRHYALGIDGAVGGLEMLTRPQIDLDRRNLDALLSHEHSRTTRIGCWLVVVELHRGLPP